MLPWQNQSQQNHLNNPSIQSQFFHKAHNSEALIGISCCVLCVFLFLMRHFAWKNWVESDNNMENYKLLGRIGKGAHGLVFKALDKRNNQTVALKQIAILNVTAGLPKNTMREINVLRVLRSKHIVKLTEVFNLDNTILLAMEYLQYSLTDLIQNIDKPLTLPQIKSYSKMILMGVNTMHSNNIMHRDLKPANLLINDEGILKIADFGLSRIFNSNKKKLYTHQVGTRWYRAPELLYGSQEYTTAIDMWAVGCILAEMINKQPLFPGETDIGQLAIVISTLGTPNEETWPGLSSLPDYNKISFAPTFGQSWEACFPDVESSAIDLIRNMLLYDYTKRLTAADALNHPFFFEKPLPCDFGEMPRAEDITKQDSFRLKDFDDIISPIV